MKKALIPIIVGLVVVCGVGGYGVRTMMAGRGKADTGTTTTARVERGNLVVTVVETGTVDASKAVEVKSRVSGRLQRLLVDEGDFVQKNQLIALIDPQETELTVRQNAAQLRGAQSAVDRAGLEINQRRTTNLAAYRQAQVRLTQLQLEMQAQPKLTRAAIQSAQTALATAQQEKTRLLESAQPTSRTQAESAVKEAKANYDNAESEYRRQADLEGKGYVAGKLVESAKLSLDLAKVRLETAQDGLAKLEAQQHSELAKANEAIRQAQAQLTQARTNAVQDRLKVEEVASAQADVEKAKAALSDPAIMAKQRDQSVATVDQLSSLLSDSERQLHETQVRAPISGVVTKKELEEGELATGLSGFSSGTPIVRIEDRRSMRVKLSINEIDVAKLQCGQKVNVEVDAIPNDTITGTVVKISPASDQPAQGQPSSDAVVRYQVEVLLDRPSSALRSGMSARCSMDVLRRDNVLILPIEYVEKQDDKYYANVVIGGGKTVVTQRREVKVGAKTGAKVEILSGIKAGEEVQRPAFTGPKRQGFMGGPGDDQ